MTTRFFRKFFKTAFVGIIIDDDMCEVSVIIYKNKNRLSSETKKFQLQDGVSPTSLLSYMEQIYEENPYVYASTMLTSINQGAIPECSKDAFGKFQVDSRNIKSICIDGRWTVYTGKTDVESIDKKYEKLGGIDFVFSPMLILQRFFAKDILEGGTVMTALKSKSIICVAIFNGNRLLYASLMSVKTPESEKAAIKVDSSESAFEDFFDDDEVHELGEDGMVDLDDLSINLDDDSHMPVLSDNIEDEALKEATPTSRISLEEAGNDLKLADFIKESIGEFYKNQAYESSFIDKIFIADPNSQDSDTKMILENELMMSVEVRNIEISSMLCSMTTDEVQ